MECREDEDGIFWHAHGTQQLLNVSANSEDGRLTLHRVVETGGRVFGLFTDTNPRSKEHNDIGMILELTRQGAAYTWATVRPQCVCGRFMKLRYAHVDRCVRAGIHCSLKGKGKGKKAGWHCPHGDWQCYAHKICSLCAPCPMFNDWCLDSDEDRSFHLERQEIDDLPLECYFMVALGTKLWICIDSNVWIFDTENNSIQERGPLSVNGSMVRKVLFACAFAEGRQIYLDAVVDSKGGKGKGKGKGKLDGHVCGALHLQDDVFHTWSVPVALPCHFVNIAENAVAGLLGNKLMVLTKDSWATHELSFSAPETLPAVRVHRGGSSGRCTAQMSMMAEGPRPGQLVVFASGCAHKGDDNDNCLVRPRWLITLPEAAAHSIGESRVEALTSFVAVPSMGPCWGGLLRQSIRYPGTNNYVFFSLSGKVFQMLEEDMMLPEQLWRHPRWDLSADDARILTFKFKSAHDGDHTRLKGHVFVLRRYGYFASLLDGWSEGQSLEVLVEGIDKETFARMLKFAYNGRLAVDLQLGELISLVQASSMYLMLDLTEAAMYLIRLIIRSEHSMGCIPADELAQVICMAETLPSGSASLFQELAASVLLYKPLVLRDESFLARIAQDSPRSLASLIAAQQDCSRLNPEEVHMKRATRKLCDTTGFAESRWSTASHAADATQGPPRQRARR